MKRRKLGSSSQPAFLSKQGIWVEAVYVPEVLSGRQTAEGKSCMSSPLVTREWMGVWKDLPGQESLDELLALLVYLPTEMDSSGIYLQESELVMLMGLL